MEIVLITDYSNTKDKKQHLRKLIKDVKQHFDVCLNSQKITIFKNNKKIIRKFHFKKNDIFIKELKFFLSKIKSNSNISDELNLFNGIKTLRFAMKLKKNFL